MAGRLSSNRILPGGPYFYPAYAWRGQAPVRTRGPKGTTIEDGPRITGSLFRRP